jgi:hypothetical protein
MEPGATLVYRQDHEALAFPQSLRVESENNLHKRDLFTSVLFNVPDEFVN